MSSLRSRVGVPLLLSLVVVASLLSACTDDGGDDVGISIVARPADDAPATTDPGDPATDDSADAADSTDTTDSGAATEPTDRDTTDSSDTTEPEDDDEPEGGLPDPLPGEPFDIGPPPGTSLDVIGVRFDDVLNFRQRPQLGAPIIDTAAPLSATPTVVSMGEGRSIGASIWWRVLVGGEEAWANLGFLGVLGQTDDVLSQIESSPAPTTGETLNPLLDGIARSRADGPEPRVARATDIVRSGGQATIVIDVIGIGDDAVKGERLELTFDEGTDSFTLVGAERTVICGRGATPAGLCL